MSFKTIQDIINFYQKERKPMINNSNFNPEKLADFKEMDRVQRYENGKRRMLVDMRIRQNDPSYRVTPDEEIVDISEVKE